MSRVGVVVNPTAGRGRGAACGARAVELLRSHGHRVSDLSVVDPHQAPAQVREAAGHVRDAAGGLDALVVVGGDGMVHLGANAVAGTDVPLGVVAVGSGNDIAASAGLPRHDVEAAVRVVDAGLRSGGRRVDAVAVDAVPVDRPAGARAAAPRAGGRPGAAAPHAWYLGVLSCGLDAAVSARAATLLRSRAEVRYVRALLAELRTFRPYGMRVTVDGRTWEGTASLVAVANAPRFGGGMRIAPGARMDDGVLDVVLAGPLTRAGILRVFPRVYSGAHIGHPACTVLRGRSVLVEPTTAGPVPPAAFADGEPLGPLPLRARVHPGAVRLLA